MQMITNVEITGNTENVFKFYTSKKSFSVNRESCNLRTKANLIPFSSLNTQFNVCFVILINFFRQLFIQTNSLADS